MRRTLVVMALACGGLAACEDEEAPPPPMEPQIQSPSAKCRSVEGVYLLESVTFRVRDLDGTDDLFRPVVVAGATPLTVIDEVIPWDPAATEECLSEREPPACDVVYRWSRNPQDPNSERIFCGEDGKLLQVEVEVQDRFGYRKTGRFGTTPE